MKRLKKFGCKAKSLLVAGGAMLASGAAMADTGTDPTSTIVSQLQAYAPDIAAIVGVMLTLYYGKKLLPALKV